MNRQRWCNIAYICSRYIVGVTIKMQKTLITTTALVVFSTLAAVCNATLNVPPPTNVTLQCHNNRNILSWNYSQPSRQPRFRIDIGQKHGKREPLLVEYPNVSCDLSFLRDPSNEYYVTVTAVGETESDPVPEEGLSFSYFMGSYVDIICKLDLPPVNVTVQNDGRINISFVHPSKVYGEKERRQKKHLRDLQNPFKYTVRTKGQKEDEAPKFTCDREVCTETVLAGPESHCVEINGKWKGILVEATQEYCARTGPPADTTSQMLAYILCPVALLCIAVIVGWMAFRKLTSGSSTFPKAMDFSGKEEQETVESQEVFPVERSSPGTTPLLSDVQDVVSITEEPEVCIGTTVLDESMSSVLEDEQGESEMGEESCYDSGKVLDEEENNNEGESGYPEEGAEGRSAYEGRDRLTTELSPGEEVEAYRE